MGGWYCTDSNAIYVRDEGTCRGRCEVSPTLTPPPEQGCALHTITSSLNLKNNCTSVRSDIVINYCMGSCDSEDSPLVFDLEESNLNLDIGNCKCCMATHLSELETEFVCNGGQ